MREPPEICALPQLYMTPLSLLVYHRSPDLNFIVAGNTHRVYTQDYSLKEAATPSLCNETDQKKKNKSLLVNFN